MALRSLFGMECNIFCRRHCLRKWNELKRIDRMVKILQKFQNFVIISNLHSCYFNTRFKPERNFMSNLRSTFSQVQNFLAGFCLYKLFHFKILFGMECKYFLSSSLLSEMEWIKAYWQNGLECKEGADPMSHHSIVRMTCKVCWQQTNSAKPTVFPSHDSHPMISCPSKPNMITI